MLVVPEVVLVLDEAVAVEAAPVMTASPGWTPLMMAGGVFFANAKKEYPAAAAILKKAMAEQGLLAAAPNR